MPIFLFRSRFMPSAFSSSECEDVRQTVRAFLSYQTKDKVVAGNVRAFLEKVEIQSFLAHEDKDLRPA
jgi:hypothetical protein